MHIQVAMREHETKAWKALAGYKFVMFGYHAGVWVNLNKLLPKPEPNPFRRLVVWARGGGFDRAHHIANISDRP